MSALEEHERPRFLAIFMEMIDWRWEKEQKILEATEALQDSISEQTEDKKLPMKK